MKKEKQTCIKHCKIDCQNSCDWLWSFKNQRSLLIYPGCVDRKRYCNEKKFAKNGKFSHSQIETQKK